MTRWVAQPSPTLICFLSSLCTGLLFIIIILLVTVTRQGVDHTEHSMELKLRNLSLWVHSRVEGLSQHDTLKIQKLAAMETFVKDLRKSEMMSKMKEIETSMKYILSEKVIGSFSNDHQNILEALGDLAEEIWKGNSSVDPSCEPGWMHHDSSCYILFRQIQPWKVAKAICEDKKAHLVVINSIEEMSFLREFSRSLTLWIGLTDQSGAWEWVDGTPYEKTPKFWKPGQPDFRISDAHIGTEICVHMVDGDGWNDIHCSMTFSYICEKTKP
ncbi:asialoglycoprotein receptor 1-like [Mantella aurantiaca]